MCTVAVERNYLALAPPMYPYFVFGGVKNSNIAFLHHQY